MTPIVKSQFKVSGLVWDRIFSNIVALIIFGICDAILSFILSAFVPVIGVMIVGIFNVCFGIGLFVGVIVWFIDLIAFCCSSLEVNETGLVGKGDMFAKIDLAYSDIDSIVMEKKRMVIKTNIPLNKKGTKTKVIVFSNAKNMSEIYEAYAAQSAKVNATATAEA